jgi:hypothetical protein
MNNNSYENITSTNIKFKNYLNLDTIVNCQNLVSLELENINILNFIPINQLLDNLNFEKIKTLDCNFILNESLIQLKLIDKLITLSFSIDLFSCSFIKYSLENLSLHLEYLHIVVNKYYTGSTFKNIFTNLPTNLKKIVIEYNDMHDEPINSLIKKINSYNGFLCLFDAKIPFGCVVDIHIKVTYNINNHINNIINDNMTNNKTYIVNVIYENNLLDQLILVPSNYFDEEKKEFTIVKQQNQCTIFSKNYNILRHMDGVYGLSYSN